MTERDPLSLQNFLFTCARSLGGTWRPAPCVIGDVAICADESSVLGDGSTMRLRIVITAQAIDTDKPRLHLTHLLHVKTNASTNPATPPSVSAYADVACAFYSVDEVLCAIDETTALVNDQMGALVAALAVSHV
jgi:hypothetical protein